MSLTVSASPSPYVNTWYRNKHGRIAQNWPFTLLEYWERTRRPNIDDYVLRG